jgi:hypothetical protein
MLSAHSQILLSAQVQHLVSYERVSNTPMRTDLLQSFQVFTEFVVERIGKELCVFSIHNILLSVEEPFRDFILCRILNNCDNTFKFFSSKLSSTKALGCIAETVIPFVKVNIGLFDDDVRVSSSHTLDSGQSKHDLLFSINISVEKTENVLESVLIWDNKSHGCRGELFELNKKVTPVYVVCKG